MYRSKVQCDYFRVPFTDVDVCRSGHMSNSVEIQFDERQKAVAPGQVAAVYDGDWCLGSGTIVHTE